MTCVDPGIFWRRHGHAPDSHLVALALALEPRQLTALPEVSLLKLALNKPLDPPHNRPYGRLSTEVISLDHSEAMATSQAEI